jgi:hypothetical protein
MTSAALTHFTAWPNHLTRTYRALLQSGQFQLKGVPTNLWADSMRA